MNGDVVSFMNPLFMISFLPTSCLYEEEVDPRVIFPGHGSIMLLVSIYGGRSGSAAEARRLGAFLMIMTRGSLYPIHNRQVIVTPSLLHITASHASPALHSIFTIHLAHPPHSLYVLIILFSLLLSLIIHPVHACFSSPI